ncbi:Sel1 repeat protein [mine drainage metagenome]|uniref:Sel1 repeat protein n=1 Tax=mine drainage metagenome TaxID=410659 RepID=A0A1J5RM66_9ZZZZ
MKSIEAHAFWKCFALGLGLFVSLELPAYANSVTRGLIDENLSIEAPLVRLVLKRAALMERSEPTARNRQYAARLYCVAARLGSLEAQYHLGKMILAGWGMKKNAQEAAALFSIAAGQGHEKAGEALELISARGGKPPECMENPGRSIDIDAPGPAGLHARASLNNQKW